MAPTLVLELPVADADRGARGRRGAMPNRPDPGKWAVIEQAYVQGREVEGEYVFPSQAQLAAQFGIGERTLAEHCTARGWVGKRQAFLDNVTKGRERTRLAKLVKEGEQFDAASLAVAKSLLAQVVRTFRLHGEEPQRPLDPKTLAQLASTAAKAQQMGRLVLNMPTGLTSTPAENEERAARLALDPDEARRLQELEGLVARGEIDIVELYRQASGIFAAERDAAGEEGTGR